MSNPGRYHAFELDISNVGGRYRAELIDSPSGQATGYFDLPISEPDLKAWYEQRSGEYHLQQIGASLFEALFSGEIGNALIESLARIEGESLRISLRLHNAPELALIPWEVMYSAIQNRFLLLSERTTIVRYLALRLPEPAMLLVKPPLRILSVFSNPLNVSGLDVEAEWRALDTSFAALKAKGLVSLERIVPATLDNLRKRLMLDPIHAFHFVGHGVFDEELDEGNLVFEDASGKAVLIESNAIGNLLHSHSSLRFVFLNACDTARSSAQNIFTGLASNLVRQGVPAVIAMQRPIYDASAARLADAFYQALSLNYPLDAALDNARLALAANNDPEWSAPVLFSRSRDNLLIFVPPSCPYPGLPSFTEEQSTRFFGRQREINEILERLRLHPFLALIGPSGSGKSSLVYAGVIPILCRRVVTEQSWCVHTIRPGKEPHSTLLQALNVELANPDSPRFVQPTLLFVDQFEELFAQSDPKQAQFFLALIGRLIGCENLTIVLTIRADFFADIMNSAIWNSIKSNRLEITTLGAHGLRDAIIMPARQVGVTIDGALVERLLADAALEPGALPLVQETMTLLWEKVTQPRLELAAYEELGRDGQTGLQVGISRRADVTYENFNDAEKNVASRMFVNLVQIREGRNDTRRQLPENRLLFRDSDAQTFDSVLQKLVQQRLITVNRDEATGLRLVDISHDALIAGWPKLRGWLNDRRRALLLQDSLENLRVTWVKNKMDSSGLLRGRQLATALESKASDPDLFTVDQITYLRKSRNYERRTRRLRGGAMFAFVLLFIPGLFVGLNAWMYFQRMQSNWQPIDGFPSSPVTSFATSAGNGDGLSPQICVGTDHVGVGCSTDGVSWNIYESGLPTGIQDRFNSRKSFWGYLVGGQWSGQVRSVLAIAMNRQDPAAIYAFLRNDGLYRSIDSGVNWSPLLPKPAMPEFPQAGASKIYVDGDRIFVGAGTQAAGLKDAQRGHLFVGSLQDGSWQMIDRPQSDMGYVEDYAVLNSATGQQELFIAATNGFYRSSEADSWIPQKLADAPTNSGLIAVVNDPQRGVFYLAGYDPAKKRSYLYQWRPESSALTHWGDGHEGAVRAFVANPSPLAQDLLWVLFENGDVYSVGEDGAFTARGARPGWLWAQTNAIWSAPGPGDDPDHFVPYLGHADGVLQCQNCPN